MRGFILLSMSFSNVFAMVDRREMGRYEEGWVGGLFGFNMGMIFACFQFWGMSFVSQDLLNICVRALQAMGPRCFRWRFEILSGPVAWEFFRDLIHRAISSGEKGGGVLSSGIFFRFLMIVLFWFCVGRKLILE